MKSSFKNFNRWLAAFGVAAFLMVGGWQIGVGGTEAVFSETAVALENAFAGSIDPNQPGIHCRCHNDGVCYGGNQISVRKLCHYGDSGSADCNSFSSNCPN